VNSVFLSYARADDEAFVARVRAFLVAHGFTVWRDREDMAARSLPFPEEIRNAIHACERFVVVIGPRALRSDHVRAEWQAALSERKSVVTVLRLVPEGFADPHACLPPELKLFHAEPFLVVDGKEPPLDRLVQLLRDPIPPPPPILGRPPERPPHFRPRPDEFSALFGLVLGETSSPDVRVHARRVTVLSGMGGIGKTVLAASLVEALRSRPTTFLADGVYWLQGDDPVRRLAALCGARPVADGDTRDAVVDEVARLLDGRRFLLVVDNAKAVDQIAPLVRVLGPGGRMLVTTRHGELGTGHLHRQVGRLSDGDALQLVADWLGIGVDAVQGEARRMVELCGFHPFAIALNAAAVSQGLPWSAVVTALEQCELDYAEHRFEEYVYATVEHSLDTSLNALKPADRARYRDLAAFFWDGGVPCVAITRFWRRRGRLPVLTPTEN
jgi:TIR domain/NB-ARC domain